MSERDRCLDAEEIALWIEGGGEGGRRARIEGHLSACAGCRRAWAEAAEEAGEDPVPQGAVERIARAAAAEGTRPGLRLRRFRLPALWAAAAAAFVALLPALRLLSPAPEKPPRALPEGERVAGRSEALRVASGESPRVVETPDGTRLRVHPATRFSFREPGPGERLVGLLERGTVEADVVKGASQVRIATGAGDVVVVGTRFTVRAFKIHQETGVRRQESGDESKKQAPSSLGEEDRGEGGIPVLSVEVVEGTVELVRDGERLPVSAGRRGFLWPGGGPVLQELREGADLGRSLDRWRGEWPAPLTTPLLLLGAGADPWEILGRAGLPEARRRSAARLATLSAEPEDAARLLRLFASETDDTVRLILLPGMLRAVRASDGDAAALIVLGGILEGGASGRLREETEALLEEIAE